MTPGSSLTGGSDGEGAVSRPVAFSDDFNEVYDARPNKHLSQPVEVCVVGKRCVYVNDYRIAGGKPYVSENLPSHEFVTTMQSIVDAFDEERLLAAVQERKAQREYFAAYHAWKATQPPPRESNREC